MAAKYSKFEQGTPPPGYIDTEIIRLSRNGVWLAGTRRPQGNQNNLSDPNDMSEITHEPTRRLFARSLRQDEQGYFLHIGREMKRIEVEDTAYFVERLEGSSSAGYLIYLNDGTSEKLDSATLRYQPGRLTCQVHQGEDEAKFLSVPYMELLKQVEEDENGFFLLIEGTRVRLGA